MRETQATYFYGIVGGITVFVAALGMFVAQRWEVLGFPAAVWLVLGGYGCALWRARTSPPTSGA